MDFLYAIILGLVEGVTEFLPISSTGHMILVSTFLPLKDKEFWKTFEIAIQLGAILAIVFLYAGRLLKNWEIYKKITAAFIPAAVVGFIFYKLIKGYLFSPLVVSLSLIIGGVILLFVDKKMAKNISEYKETENISYLRAFLIGLFQAIAVVPGVSRAGATIVGGLFNGFSRKQAVEFSFLLAVPTMIAASGYDLLKTPLELTGHHFLIIGVGVLTAFVSAFFTVKFFILFLEKYSFTFFGWYRILLGLVFLRLLL
jgi:undecaprenyl-diphosphatase